ncbi:MAG: metallophosphoesterase family protein [Pseudomonadota bacterium]
MRLALLADLHANREATEACLSKLRRLGFDRIVLLGDIVGYGADPEWTVDTARRMVDDGALAVYGNHDEAVVRDARADAQQASRKHAHAQAAIDWTRDRLDAAQRAFLAALPARVDDGDRLYVHANAWAPLQWGYIANALAAAQSMAATEQRVTFCGHVHEPALYHSLPEGGARHFAPTPGVATPLLGSRRWLALPGSVGQPRDGNPAACCALYDAARGTLATLRVAYDHETAARKIVAAGLPESLAKRLVEGR